AERAAPEAAEPAAAPAPATGKPATREALARDEDAGSAAESPAGPALRRREQDDHQDLDEQQRHPAEGSRHRRPAPARREAGRRQALVAVEARRQRRDAAPHAVVDVAGTERRHHLAILDLADETVGQHALDAVAREDAELAVLHGEQHEDAGV